VPQTVCARVLPGLGRRHAAQRCATWFKHEMWRFQIPAQVIAKYIPSFIEYPPMQAGASFNIADLKEKVEAAAAAAKASGE
jgi:hypothetical protein